MSTSDSLCPSNTSTIDFAYPPTHVLHRSNHPRRSRAFSSDDSDSDSDDLDHFPLDPDDHDSDSLAPEEINRKAIALFDFIPENDNEIQLTEGQEIWISYRHGQGWLVAENPVLAENGLVPEQYVSIVGSPVDEPKPFIPRILQDLPNSPNDDSEWEDTDFDEEDGDFGLDPGQNSVPSSAPGSSLEGKMQNTSLH